jgi:glycerol-3-phosphate acyltransferase PlsY
MVIEILALVGIFLLAYLLGSLPTGYLAGQWLKGIDIRSQGSGSTGATNVLRTLGKGPAIVVLGTDILKGTAAVLLSIYLYNQIPQPLLTGFSQDWVACLAALLALLGHSKPVWLGFQGGKSAATGLGVVFAMSGLVGLGTFATFGLTLAAFRIVSVSSISASIALNVLMWITGQPLAYKCFAFLGGGYVIWRHQSNIQRLLAGTEPKIGQKLNA